MSLDDPRPPPLWISIHQACDTAGVSRRTIYNWLRKDRLVYQRTAGGAIRIDAASLWRPKAYRP